MSDIFLSYASQDRHRIGPLVALLQKQGWSVFWDRTMLPGQKWEQVIETELDRAGCVVVLWSNHSVQSEWVLIEAGEAKTRGVLVPAILDPVRVPLQFRPIQTASLISWDGSLSHREFNSLLEGIANVLGRHALLVPPTLFTGKICGAANEAQKLAIKETLLGRWRWLSAAFAGKRTIAIGVLAAALAASTILFPWRGKEPSIKQQARPVGGASQEPTGLIVVPNAEVAPNRYANAGKTEAASAAQHIRAASPVVPSHSSTNAPVAGRVLKNPVDGLEYVWIPPGKFMMGCSFGDTLCESDEKPPREVTIVRGFWIGKTEVTAGAYGAFSKHRPEMAAESAGSPVVNVNWNEAKAFCEWTPGLRLPSEREWEYSARAGTTESRYGAPDSVAWYHGNSSDKLHEVGGKKPNTWGLFDMLGNAWEVVAEQYPGTTARVMRGGSFINEADSVRVSFRGGVGQELRYPNIGFRCAGELR